MGSMLQKIYSDDGGNPSSMRLLVAFVVAAQVLVWAYCSIKSGVLQPLALENTASIIGPLAVQAWQKGKEIPAVTGTVTVSGTRTGSAS
jgi:hypothetical protein